MPANLMRRLLFWAPAGLALAIALFVLFRPEAVMVDLATVGRGDIASSVAEEGKTRVK